MPELEHDSEYRMINSPIKWVGGKSRLRRAIIPILPRHTCYVEPFAGAAWVLFGKPPSPVEILNDKDEELINFWRVVKERPEDLVASFEWEFASRAEFQRFATMDTMLLSEIQRAHRFYYLIMAGWGGEFNYPRFQTSITDGGHGNRLIGALETLRSRLKPVYERLRTVIIECLDWRECIDRYDRPSTVMYIDPPYPRNGANYRLNMRGWEEHEELVARLRKTECKWVVSSYDTKEVELLFKGFRKISIQSSSGMRVKKTDTARVLNKEALFINYKPSEEKPHTGSASNSQLRILD